MAECPTSKKSCACSAGYNRDFLREAILMFADASGDAVSIEPDAMVRKTGAHFVQTNFHQSRGSRAEREPRFDTASQMLEQAGDRIVNRPVPPHPGGDAPERRVPDALLQLYDLRARTMHLYASMTSSTS